jgi:hypothetical protein
VVLADWDAALFDLQSGDDVLNDNPSLYLRNRMPDLITDNVLLHDLDDRQGRWSRDPPVSDIFDNLTTGQHTDILNRKHLNTTIIFPTIETVA